MLVGSIMVVVVNISGCEASSPNFGHNLTSSVREVYYKEQIKIYSNPTSTVINISEDHIVNHVTGFDLKRRSVLRSISRNTIN